MPLGIITTHPVGVRDARLATTALAVIPQVPKHHAPPVNTGLSLVGHLSRLATPVLVAKHQIPRQRVQGIAIRRAPRANGELGVAARIAPQATPAPAARAEKLVALASTRQLQVLQAAPAVLPGDIRVQARRQPALRVRQA